jgi:hypothetical protein
MRHGSIYFVRSRGPPSHLSQLGQGRPARLPLTSLPLALLPISGQQQTTKAPTVGVTRLSEPLENQTRLLASDLLQKSL